MTLKDKSKEELIELIEEKNQSIEELREEVIDIKAENTDYENSFFDKESIAEPAFYAGVKCEGDALRGWLNYRMESRL